MKLLRGAWTEGLSGIHPELRMEAVTGKSNPHGNATRQTCVRPFLAVKRAQIESYLKAIGQNWRQDASNDSLEHTRNRIRHELMPKLREFNPQIDSMLAHMAENARAEEQHWQIELGRLLPLLLLPGKPTRGGGRSVSTSDGSAEVAVEIARLRELDPALLRRVLRAAAERAGATLDFEGTERVLALVMPTGSDSGKRIIDWNWLEAFASSGRHANYDLAAALRTVFPRWAPTNCQFLDLSMHRSLAPGSSRAGRRKSLCLRTLRVRRSGYGGRATGWNCSTLAGRKK